ncbi:hypothetical protein BH18GEM1_BH18GEM1_04600 [soil metagenome]
MQIIPPARAFVASTALGGLAFVLPSTGSAGETVAALAAILAAALLAILGLALGRPRPWGLRAGYLLLLLYMAAWSWYRVRTPELEQGRPRAVARLESAEREHVAGILTRRLAADRALAVRMAGRLSDPGEPLGAPGDRDLFARLGRAVPAVLPAGIGIEVYDRAGALRAWWGDPRGERLPPDSVSAALGGALVRRPAGYTLAYAAVPWVAGRDTFRVAVKDVWAVESPLARGESDLALPELERAADLEFRVLPSLAGEPEGAAETPRSIVREPDDGSRPAAVVVSERFMLDRFLDERRRETRRVLALLYLWPFLWTTGALWQAARSAVQRPARERRERVPPGWERWGTAIGGQAALLAVVWAFLMESRFLSLLLPRAWFSPLAFASGLLGPGGRSPGDFVTTAALAALFSVSTFTLLPAPERRAGMVRVALAAAFAVGIAALAARAAAGTMEAAMQSMSPPVFFSPTLLFSPPYLMVLLGFALLGAVGIAGLGAGFRALGAATGPPALAAGAAVALAGLAGAAWSVPEAALAGRLSAIVPFLAVGMTGAGWLAHAAAGTAAVSSVRLGIVAVGMGAVLTVPVATYARVQAAHELLVERAERIGLASTQWLDYSMSRTAEFLAGNPAVAEAIEGENRDAALLLWSQSPLRTLDFASGLYLIDAEGTIVSQFALTAVDLAGRARQHAREPDAARITVEGSPEEGGIWWATVPVPGPDSPLGTAVAMSTDALELREPTPGSAFILSDLLAGSALPPDLPGYTTLGPEEEPPPRTLLTSVRRAGGGSVQLAMPLGPLLPEARGYAVFGFVGAICGLLIAVVERWGDTRARSRWWAGLRSQNPLRSFRVQLLLAFLAVAAIPLALYAVLGFRATRLELEEATRAAAAEALGSASRMLAGDVALAEGTTRDLTARLREVATILQQDIVLYWRGRTIASSRPEIFASRLFADRLRGEVYTDLFVTRQPIAFDSMMLGGRSFLVAYRPLAEPGAPAGYVLATPLLIREDRARIDVQRLGEGVFLLSVFSVGFLLIVGWGLARYMTRPLSLLEKGTRQIAAGRLSYRLPAPARLDEFGRLQRAFNAMAARLDRGQRALEREKSRVQAILASVGAGVVALDEDGRVRLLNDRAAALLEERPEDVLDRPVGELADGDRRAASFWRAVAREFMAAAAASVGRATPAGRELVLRRGGEDRHYTIVCTPLRDGAGEERGLVVAFEDITANVQSQRVLAWGEMARQVAHEIKNPLTPMKLSLQHLERAVDDQAVDFEEMFHKNVDLVLAEIERLERIAGNFARFAVPDPAVREPFDPLAAARDVVALFAPGEEGIAYELESAGEPRPLLGDPEGFRRILVNLIQNSRDAVLAAGGREVFVRLDWAREPGWAWISVLDDGIGIPAESLDRLFEPSFSTKTRGTGLGLAITRRIVEAWGGTIDYERRKEGGTAIHVRLKSPPEDADR